MVSKVKYIHPSVALKPSTTRDAISMAAAAMM
jgi:hypothetical protein